MNKIKAFIFDWGDTVMCDFPEYPGPMVDWPRVEAWRGTDYTMTQVWEEAQRRGDMRPFQKTIMGFWWTPTRPP